MLASSFLLLPAIWPIVKLLSIRDVLRIQFALRHLICFVLGAACIFAFTTKALPSEEAWYYATSCLFVYFSWCSVVCTALNRAGGSDLFQYILISVVCTLVVGVGSVFCLGLIASSAYSGASVVSGLVASVIWLAFWNYTRAASMKLASQGRTGKFENEVDFASNHGSTDD